MKWSLFLRLIRVKRDDAWVDVDDDQLHVHFGTHDEEIPLDQIESLEPRKWPFLYGIGVRLADGLIGYVGSTKGVIQVNLREPFSFRLIGSKRSEKPAFAVSLEDPDAFVDDVRERL